MKVFFSCALTHGTSVLHEPCSMSNVRESEEENKRGSEKEGSVRRQQETSKERDARSCSNSD